MLRIFRIRVKLEFLNPPIGDNNISSVLKSRLRRQMFGALMLLVLFIFFFYRFRVNLQS